MKVSFASVLLLFLFCIGASFGALDVLEPEGLKSIPVYNFRHWGVQDGDATGQVVFAETPFCEPSQQNVSDKIVVAITNRFCPFEVTALNAQQAGAIAVIFLEAGEVGFATALRPDGDTSDVKIPTLVGAILQWVDFIPLLFGPDPIVAHVTPSVNPMVSIGAGLFVLTAIPALLNLLVLIFAARELVRIVREKGFSINIPLVLMALQIPYALMWFMYTLDPFGQLGLFGPDGFAIVISIAFALFIPDTLLLALYWVEILDSVRYQAFVSKYNWLFIGTLVVLPVAYIAFNLAGVVFFFFLSAALILVTLLSAGIAFLIAGWRVQRKLSKEATSRRLIVRMLVREGALLAIIVLAASLNTYFAISGEIIPYMTIAMAFFVFTALLHLHRIYIVNAKPTKSEDAGTAMEGTGETIQV